MTIPVTSAEVSALQRRSVTTLAGSQVLGGVGVSAGVAVGSLLAADLSGSETWAGLGGTAQVLGGALCAIVVARVMAAKGRRLGLVVGYLLAIGGALLVVGGAVTGSFALFLLGSLLFGGAVAANSQARFAATDLSDDRRRARHLSIVVWATTIGAVAGPNLTGPGGELARRLGIPALAGPFAFSLVGFVLAVLVLHVALRPDPLLVARAGHTDVDEPGRTQGGPGSGLQAIRAHPRARLGVVVMALGHAVMASVMVMTPLHMRHGDAGLEVIGIVISGHIVGMYAFSPVTGWAVDRVGGRPVAGVGALVLLTSCALAAASEAGFSVLLASALFVLGLGWSCTLISGSTLLTEVLPLRQRPAAQGVADVAMGLAGGGGGALAGVIVGQWGYPALAVAAGVVAVLLGVLVVLAGGRRC